MYPQFPFFQKNPFRVSEIGVAGLKNDIKRRNFLSVLPLTNFRHEVYQAITETEAVFGI
jgi:hypothetical protein